MADSQAPASSKARGGCFFRLPGLIIVCALGLGIYLISQPQNLTDLRVVGTLNRELITVLKEAIQSNTPVTLSEGDLNRWLAATLVAKQGGLAASQVSFERVCVRLEPQRAEIVMLRRCFGRPFTVSMYLKIERSTDAAGPLTTIRPNGGPFLADYPYPPIGGRFGQLVVPQAFLHLILPAYERLAAQCSEEINLAVVKMWRVRIEPGKLVLDPREPLGNRGMPQSF